MLLWWDWQERVVNPTAQSPRLAPQTPTPPTSTHPPTQDIKPLSKYSYKYIVVDEGHRLKNSNCKLLRELRTLDVQNKLLLTGTPLQNNLAELWSLLNYLLPDIFSNLADFESWFDIAGNVASSSDDGDAEMVVATQRARVVDKLHSLLKPFLLRRIKADVEIALPRKQELLLFAPMSKLQRQLNQQLLERTLAVSGGCVLVGREGGHQGRFESSRTLSHQPRTIPPPHPTPPG